MIKSLLLLGLLVLGGCSTRGLPGRGPQSPPVSAVATTTKHTHATMRPYTVRGRTYYPTIVHKGDSFDGVASWYGPNFHGKRTSNGERYDMHAATAAHKTLPMNTIVRVTNKRNGLKTVVRINDRGPFVASRIIDLSKKAAKEIDLVHTGTSDVHLEVLGFAKTGTRHIPTDATLRSGPNQRVVSSFYIQIGAFKNFSGAAITQEKYDGLKGHKTIIKDSEYNNSRLFRVWLGSFASEEEARDFIAASDFAHAFIVRK